MSIESIIKSIAYKGFTITIDIDENPCHPRKEMDNLSTLYFFGKVGQYGDDHNLPDPRDLGLGTSAEHLQWMRENFKQGTLIIPVRGYVHSGVSFSLSNAYPYNDQFDSGCAGFAVVTFEDMMKCYNPQNEQEMKDALDKCVKVVEAELQTLNKYLNGECYYMEVKLGEEVLDSCGGYDDIEYAVTEAQTFVDSYINEHTAKPPVATPPKAMPTFEEFIGILKRNPVLLKELESILKAPTAIGTPCKTGCSCKPPMPPKVQTPVKPSQPLQPLQPVKPVASVPIVPIVPIVPTPKKESLEEIVNKMLINPKTGKTFTRKELTRKRLEDVTNVLAKYVVSLVK